MCVCVCVCACVSVWASARHVASLSSVRDGRDVRLRSPTPAGWAAATAPLSRRRCHAMVRCNGWAAAVDDSPPPPTGAVQSRDSAAISWYGSVGDDERAHVHTYTRTQVHTYTRARAHTHTSRSRAVSALHRLGAGRGVGGEGLQQFEWARYLGAGRGRAGRSVWGDRGRAATLSGPATPAGPRASVSVCFPCPAVRENVRQGLRLRGGRGARLGGARPAGPPHRPRPQACRSEREAAAAAAVWGGAAGCRSLLRHAADA